MASALLKSRTLVFVLAQMLLVTALFAETKTTWKDARESFPAEVQKDLELADRLESYRYDKSALYYLKRVYRTTPNLTPTQLALLDEQIQMIEKRIGDAVPTKPLPNLEVMMHFDPPTKAPTGDLDLDKVSTTENQALRPENFPSTRIDKKKWVIRTLIAVGIGVVAYKIIDNSNRKKPPEPNSVVIEF